MLKIVAKSRIKEACVEQYLAAVKELVQKSQAEEGNISYTVNQSANDLNVFAFIEVWKDQASFEYHTQTEHFTTILPTLKEYVEESFPAEFFKEVEM